MVQRTFLHVEIPSLCGWSFDRFPMVQVALLASEKVLFPGMSTLWVRKQVDVCLEKRER